MTTTNTPQEPGKGNWFKRHKILTGIGIFVIALLVMGGIFGETDDDSSSETETSQSSNEDTKDDKTNNDKKEEKKPSAKEQLVADIKDAGNKVDVDFKHKQDVKIHDKYPEGFTEGNARGNSQRTITKMLKVVAESKWFDKNDGASVAVDQQATLVDDYGKESNDTVVHALYLAEDIKEINFDNFDATKSWDIAHEKFIHPAIRG